jgi:hypothetical protein
VIYDGIRQEFATLRANDVSAVLGADRAKGQTCVKVAFDRCRDDGGDGGLCAGYNVNMSGAGQGQQVKQRRIARFFDVRAG